MTEIKSNISTLTIEDDIAVINIENGSKNLLSIPEFIDIKVLEDALNKNPQITSLIITGEGRHFSHGADTSFFNKDGSADILSKKLKSARELLNYIEGLPLITVAAINGGCFGGGLEIALSCQFRICNKKAILGLPETNIGVIPGMSGTERLSKLIGRRKAISMVLTGEIISASDALNYGLVDAVSDDKNCFLDAVKFIKNLTDGKTPLQIRSVVSAANYSGVGVFPNPDDKAFENILRERIIENEDNK